MAGLQWRQPVEGVNVIFLLDRSDSVPATQQDAARRYVNEAAAARQKNDRLGLVVFASEAALELTASDKWDPNQTKVLAVLNPDRTDLAAAIRLGAAAFPEHGQKRLVIASDGNENVGDALAAVMSVRPLGVTVDVIPLGTQRGHDAAVQRLGLPARIKEGQTFDAKIFITADAPRAGLLRFYRNEEYLGEAPVQLETGKNLYSFPQKLEQPGFYSYRVVLEVENDQVPQNNRATAFVHVRGRPRILLASHKPEEDQPLRESLLAADFEVRHTTVNGLPDSLMEWQSYETIFLSNIAAGEIGLDRLRLLESAVRDLGVGLVCIGGDQAYAAGSYRGTPLETILPVNMELDSKKVLPKGALVLLMHGMEFSGANQTARQTALAALDNLGPRDEMGVLLWDGSERWLFPLQEVGDKREMGRAIAGMNQGDLPSFQNLMMQAYSALKASKASLKHIIVFSDGDPAPPSDELMNNIINERITVSAVMIGGHVMPDTMLRMANLGGGRFYEVPVNQASALPDIFIKESAVILKSAIIEEPFKPRLVAASEILRGIPATEYPALQGYVGTTPKDRAETPLHTDKGDPLLAHWQFGLGRTVAFTSDAKARWARDWLGWERYRQFWSQVAQWSLRRLENADFTADITLEKGQGHLAVEAVDEQGNYRNFLALRALVISPRGERQSVALEQTGPGRYEAQFPTREVGAYTVHLMELSAGQPRGSLVLGASVNYSPEFAETAPNLPLLRRLAEYGGGKILDPRQPADNPFVHDRQRTYQPVDWYEWLLRLAIVLFVADVGVRRIQIDREEWLKATATLRRWLFFWQPQAKPTPADESLAALLARRGAVRARTTSAPATAPSPTPPATPRPELFQAKTPQAPMPATTPTRPPPPAAPPEPPDKPPTPAAPTSVTERLLEAKRRAQRKKS
ncbi:glutamine amidotransferase [Fontisphaera persica]|uniref:glutamine amidotransferase n=1 Tax=Fontisphaera persica TaxID=2974023 RepID=UPI0024BFB829|nr:VWA domain-containing protein [Fontisphaera persica]WCJ59535.1 glutamine amidotransferase [Fontisphaera persica]